MKIAIIDYGMGNIHSVAKAIALYGAQSLITNKKNDIASSDKLVLPGVGSFDDAMVELEKLDLIKTIKEQVSRKKPFLGICLGMQLLLESSQEGKEKGIGILKGEVVKFSLKNRQKVPHMGWNNLKITSADCPLFSGIKDNSQVYFCHSYYPQPVDNTVIAAISDYGLEFASALAKDNVYGVQFHPEKSQEVGLKIIKNFVELC